MWKYKSNEVVIIAVVLTIYAIVRLTLKKTSGLQQVSGLSPALLLQCSAMEIHTSDQTGLSHSVKGNKKIAGVVQSAHNVSRIRYPDPASCGLS